MAITLKDSPVNYNPAYNEIIYVWDSTNKTQENFKYIFDIYVSGVTTPTYFRLKQSPDPVYGYAIFDAHRVLENYVGSDISTTDYGFQINWYSYRQYTIKIGEEYGPSSGTTVYPDLQTYSPCYVFNGIFDFPDFKDYDETTYTFVKFLSGGSGRNYLTSQTSFSIRSNQNAWLYFIMDESNAVEYMEIKTYNSAGTLIDTFRVTPTSIGATVTVHNRFRRFSSGTKNLNLIPSAHLSLGSQSIITASVASYTLQAYDNTAAAVGDLITYTIDSSCTNHNVYQLHFLNKYGGFDQFSFTRQSRFNSSIERSRYKKSVGSVSSAGLWSYNKSDRGDINFNTSIKDRVILNSDWITEAQATWLEELITSPEVYYDDGTNLFAINITNSGYERRKRINDKNFNLTLEFEYSYNRYRQRY